jgi:hypothetical protein
MRIEGICQDPIAETVRTTGSVRMAGLACLASAERLAGMVCLALPLLGLLLAGGCMVPVAASANGTEEGNGGAGENGGPEAGEVVQSLGPPPRCMEARADACSMLECVNGVPTRVPLPDGSPCTVGGVDGSCVGGGCVTPPTGRLYPKYLVLQVMYAPPGTESTVAYDKEQTFGTTLSTNSSWSATTELSVSSKAGVLGSGGGYTTTSSRTVGGSRTGSLDLKSTTSVSHQLSGFQDAIDHSIDEIWLWLNPVIDATISGNTVTWYLTTRPGTTPTVVYVTPHWLTVPGTMPPGLLQQLQAANITPADYGQILAVDPFAGGATSIDPQRFVYQTTFPYEPPAINGQHPAIDTYSVDKATTQSASVTVSASYSVGYTIEGDVDFLGLVGSKIKVSNQLTFTHDASFARSTGTSMHATASIEQPAYGYAGPILLRVYLDTLFNTFLFSLEN